MIIKEVGGMNIALNDRARLNEIIVFCFIFTFVYQLLGDIDDDDDHWGRMNITLNDPG